MIINQNSKGLHSDLPVLDGKVGGNDFSFSGILEKMYLEHGDKIYPDSISSNIKLLIIRNILHLNVQDIFCS
ncbi:hypothetical protein HDF18_11050 [Mucilaginibacter sp. X5P1]|uniref:hypothetical protein n=1 Tax=Mucilaginibacter sp. X5P1 TaxID=2723088 RepID=UPI00161730B2|nr:hypothetical protein [Mucilaginibacter sp. X5P1]MBB6140657.1 hypothetical protein [Mucilaginibacter sp. X5P1]